MKTNKCYVSTDTYVRSPVHMDYPPSICQPNMAMTIKEIYSRFIRQQPLPGVKESVYSSSDLSDYDKMDRLDKADAAIKLKDRIALFEYNTLKAKQEAEKVAADLKRKSDIDEQVEARLATLSKSGVVATT